jgi:hypothetical protein
MRTKPLLLAALVICPLFAGCYDSKNPLSDPEKSKLDPRLSGLWLLRERDRAGLDARYFHIGVAGDKLPPGVMRAVEVGHNSDGTLERPVEFLMFSTTIGSSAYLNLAVGSDEQLKALKEKGWKGVEGYFLMKYTVEGDTLLVWKMDADAKQRAIESRKVRGEITPEGVLEDMNTLTDTMENVARFVAAAGDSSFATNAGHLDRVK